MRAGLNARPAHCWLKLYRHLDRPTETWGDFSGCLPRGETNEHRKTARFDNIYGRYKIYL